MSGPESMRVAVLASGGGSDFQSLIDRFESDDAAARIVGLVASRQGAGALERAARHGIEACVLPEEARADRETEAAFVIQQLRTWNADLIVLAGYLRLVPPRVVRAFWGGIINIHPALLPAFGGEGMYGSHVHRAVVESGVRVTGATVHFVDEAYDRGPIIAQWPVPVLSDDTPATVAARVLEVEHRLLPAVVSALARGHVSLDEEGVVRWTEEWYRGEHFRLGAETDELESQSE